VDSDSRINNLVQTTSGSRSIRNHLRRLGYKINRKRVQRLMRLMGLEAIYPKRKTSRPHPAHKLYAYLLRNLKIERPNQLWTADIIYLPMSKDFMYLVGCDVLKQP
jgi:putative transposase